MAFAAAKAGRGLTCTTRPGQAEPDGSVCSASTGNTATCNTPTCKISTGDTSTGNTLNDVTSTSNSSTSSTRDDVETASELLKPLDLVTVPQIPDSLTSAPTVDIECM
jgi:hypothetical protein